MRMVCYDLTLFLMINKINAFSNDSYYPRYHLAPLCGWMNDPNGFCFFKLYYYLFYQYNPNSSLIPGIAHWGRARSKDLFHWEHLPIAIYPDQWYDKDGVFSGSALIDNGKMNLFYTGHINHRSETSDHEEHQALATSNDGINIKKYKNNPILIGAKYQPDIRDPKVWKHSDKYYMVLGNSFNSSTLGRVLLFESQDKLNWKQVSILGESDGSLGYMWECPDLFQLDGKFILLFSPQGLKPQGNKYKNLYQTGYVVGDFDYSSYIFKPLAYFQELDHGHDFYATQTMLDKLGRRIVVAWFDMWQQNYPEGLTGFSGQMIIPRVLSLSKDLRLIQRPVAEIKTIRNNIIRCGYAPGGTTVTLHDKAGEVNIRGSPLIDFKLYIVSVNTEVIINYKADSGLISLDRGGEDGIRCTQWQPSDTLVLNFYIDASSIEVFCGIGEVTFSSRFFPKGSVSIRLGDSSEVELMCVFNLKRTVSVNYCP